MKSKLFAVIGVALLSMMVLAACGGGNQPAAEPTSAPTMEQPAEATSAQVVESTQADAAASDEQPTATAEIVTTEIDMEAFIAGKVDGNHDLGRIFNATKTRAEWEATLDRMIGYGAKINDQEKEMIIYYLLSR
jgi:hypothetical protein